MKEGFDWRVYQPLKGSDFVSVAGSYVLEHSYFYQSSSPAQFAQPSPVDGAVHDDPVEPRAERPAAIEAVEVLDRGD